ncbi:MAG TPA: hypothetical protein PKD09_10545 [Aggregatilinea sp.]|uniref:hypothetical protein n=1 Tax=Aggregatilinea sp. TaxID=2806333 RepID=UPI002B9BD0B3|nr:hypothetical protein [Aggregatilinea sp.]HML22081.1 hypothetical protein [Aggregatilinea sp.]
MRCRAITLLLAFVALVAVAVLRTQPPAAAQGPETPTQPAIDSGRYVISGVVVYDKETGTEHVLRFGWGVVATTPAPTDAPTATPTAPDTSVPAATSTPSPTASAEATITPSATLTPTATPAATMTTTWTLTPAPTAMPSSTSTATVQSTSSTPVPICNVTVVTSPSLRLRSDHSTAATVLAVAPTGSTWRIYEAWPMDPDATADEWVRVQLADGRAAWMAATYSGEVYAEFEDTDDCRVLRWGPGKDEPTSTPRPTSASAATDAPGATAMPNVTPTPESEITPAPTSAATKSCTVTLLENSMIRSGPSEAYAAVGSVYASDPLTIVAVATGGNYVWGQHARGWTALYTRSESAWRIGVWGSEGEACLDVPGWTAAGLGVPPYATVWGVLTTVGADKATVQKMIDIVAGAGRTPALTVVMDASMAAAFDAQAYVIWRAWPDCPAMLDDVAASVRARLDYIDQVTRHSSFDALQLTNECAWPSPSYLNAWTLEALSQARARWPDKTIIPWVWAPGTFDLEWLPVIRPALAEMAAHGDLFGLNLYPARAGVPLSTRDLWTVWTTWRYEMIRVLMEPGADPCFAVTEAGAGDGNMALTPGDAGAFVAGIDGDVCVVTLWHLSPADSPGPWSKANLSGELKRLTESIMLTLASQ